MTNQKIRYAQAKTFTPILNTKDFSKVFGGDTGFHLPIDEQGLLRAIETIAFPGTLFTIVKEERDSIIHIESLEYPYPGPYFVDKRFLTNFSEHPRDRKPSMPSSQQILQTLRALVGTRYFWGGNCPSVPEILKLYPPKAAIAPATKQDWLLQGFDCSGLIYYATQGITPRNTSSWALFGKEVSIENLSPEEICHTVKPLDAIVWKGHILFVYDKAHTIESKLHQGVILTDLHTRICDIIFKENRKPRNQWADDPLQFIIRRWHFLETNYSSKSCKC